MIGNFYTMNALRAQPGHLAAGAPLDACYAGTRVNSFRAAVQFAVAVAGADALRMNGLKLYCQF